MDIGRFSTVPAIFVGNRVCTPAEPPVVAINSRIIYLIDDNSQQCAAARIACMQAVD